MPKPRKAENKGLPARWRFLHGAYYYQVPVGCEAQWEGKQLFRLGKTLPDAYKAWVERLAEGDSEVKTIGQLLDRYALEVIPAKRSPKTRTSNRLALPRLKSVFGAMPIASIQPKHVYGYVVRRSRKNADGTGGKTVAHREVEVLSHAYTKAVEWGYLNRHRGAPHWRRRRSRAC